MTPIQYCYDKVSTRVVPFYYGIKNIPKEKRDVIVAIAALYQELMDVMLNGTDPTIGYQKMQWWRGDVMKISQGLSEHPVCIALQATSADLDVNSLITLVDGCEQMLVSPTFDTFEDAVVHIIRTAGLREVMIMDLIALPYNIPIETMYQFTIVLELVNYIQYMRSYIRRGFVLFSRDELNKFSVSLEEMQSCKTTSNLKQLLEFQVEKIERFYQKACDALTPLIRDDLKQLIVRCDIAIETVRAIKKSNFCVLEQFIQLTPLKMWWIACRSL